MARYYTPPGSIVRFGDRELHVEARTPEGYVLFDPDEETRETWTSAELERRLRADSCSIEAADVANSRSKSRGRAEQVLDLAQLPAGERKNVEFRFWVCVGLKALEAQGTRLSEPELERSSTRKRLAKLVMGGFDGRVVESKPRGGRKSESWPLPGGRTLMKYLNLFEAAHHDRMALCDRSWAKGNRTDRLTTRHRELMMEATPSWLDLRKPPWAVAHRHLKDLFQVENARRAANGLPALRPVPSVTALRKFILSCTCSTGRAVARDGKKATYNARGPGSTDVRALLIGELVEIDECKLSIIVSLKAKGIWERLSEEQRAKIGDVEKEIRIRVHLVLMLDVASRMPLAWVLTDRPCAEATRELLLMATRDKTPEQVRYRCTHEGMSAVGLGTTRTDNGTGLRNAAVKGALVGIGATSLDMRTAKSTDKPYVERMFGTMESELLNGLTGYTGRKAGALPGYDAVKGGVLDVGLLYEVITRYLIDIYPHEPHFGTGMFGRTPHQVRTQLEEGYGALHPPSLQDRRIQLGWRVEATPNDEGVRAFGLAWESTEKDTEFHLLRDLHPGRWTICIDPENIRHVTVLIPGRPEPVTARLSTTLFADLTLPQYLKVVEELRRQNPTMREFGGHDVSEARRHIEHINAAATHSHKLARSFMTQAECEAEAKRLTSGISLPSGQAMLGAVKPGSVTADEPDGSFLIGDGSTPTASVAPPPPNPEAPGDPSETGRLPRPDTKGKLT